MRRHLVSDSGTKMDSRSPLRLSYGFIMDGVRSLRNITKIASSLALVSREEVKEQAALRSRPRGRKVRSPGSVSLVPRYLTVYPDPELDSFAGVKQFYFTKNEYLNLHVSLIYFVFICCWPHIYTLILRSRYVG